MKVGRTREATRASQVVARFQGLSPRISSRTAPPERESRLKAWRRRADGGSPRRSEGGKEGVGEQGATQAQLRDRSLDSHHGSLEDIMGALASLEEKY